MKKVLIIQGNPDKQSFTNALLEAYKNGAERTNSVAIDILHLIDLNFDPVLRYGYKKRTELEPDLLQAQQLIKEADHLVVLYPTWWGGLPALLKGFIDRVFLPGFSFKYHENDPFWDKLMKGKTARVITTMDAPVWYDWLFYGNPGYRAIKKVILEFCGFKTKVTKIGGIKNTSLKKRKKWLKKVEKLAFRENQRA